MNYHIVAFIIGFILDLILGDPYCLPHPIRTIGTLISGLEKHLLKEDSSEKEKRSRGMLLVVIVCLITTIVTFVILLGAYAIHPVAGCMIEAIMTYQLLATKCLRVESMKVYKKLKIGNLEEARFSVSMIVGRDTKELDEKQVARAAVETVAENTSDGVIAPMLYTAIGGPVLGFLYKSINTMDSMIGYKNEKYLDFGRCAAKLDDVVNFLPARISAGFMLLATIFLGKQYNTRQAYRIFKRDRFCHASPNSAQTESVCAGALGLRLAGDTSYFGKVVKKPYIGDPVQEIEYEDIKKANHLLYATAIISEICLVVCLWGLTLL